MLKFTKFALNKKTPKALFCLVSQKSISIRIVALSMFLFCGFLIPEICFSQNEHTAIINFSGSKAFNYRDTQTQVSFVIKNHTRTPEETARLSEQIMQNKKITLQVFKDDIKPEAAVICSFTANDMTELNTLFHEVLCGLDLKEIIVNEQKYTDCLLPLIE